jgi:hypothetical protein
MKNLLTKLSSIGESPHSHMEAGPLTKVRKYIRGNSGNLKENRENQKSPEIAKIPECAQFRKWAVMTSTATGPTEAMLTLLDQHDWCLLVLGDEKSPKNFKKPNSSRYPICFTYRKHSRNVNFYENVFTKLTTNNSHLHSFGDIISYL